MVEELIAQGYTGDDLVREVMALTGLPVWQAQQVIAAAQNDDVRDAVGEDTPAADDS